MALAAALVGSACSCACGPFLARVDGAVVLTGADMPDVVALGLDPGRVLAHRWDEHTAGWVQIRPGHLVGADPDTTVGADDELVFVARDAGIRRPGVRPSRRGPSVGWVARPRSPRRRAGRFGTTLRGSGARGGRTMTRQMSGLSRRRFVAGVGAVGAAAVVGRSDLAGASTGPPRIIDHPFTLGVASGDPLPNGVVLWTRLAPNPTEGGGMAPETYRVRWEVAEDPTMRRVVRRGVARAEPRHAHSVHQDVRGLHADRDYWYRFRVDDHLSPVGRTRTAPRRNARPSALVFGLVNCQRYSAGYYTAYDDLVATDPDLVVHVGDYIYESPGGGVRSDPLPESITLEQYRNRYGLYKQEPSLIAAHQAAPWLFTWDDHEVENNHAGLVPEIGSATPDPADFLARRAAAYKAYWEHMPFRRPAPTGPDFPIHRRVRWGRLAELFVLDTRQYRADQCGEVGPPCDPDVDRPMLGAEQLAWLDRGLRRTPADWAVLAQQVVFSRMDFAPGPAEIFNLDQWDGYATARRRVLDSLARHRPHDNVVLTGDIHASGVSDVLGDYTDPTSAVLGAEFVGTSVSSSGSAALGALIPQLLAGNPHLKWADTSRRGWVKHTVTSAEWRADYRHVDDARVPGSPVTTATSWRLPRGGAVGPA